MDHIYHIQKNKGLLDTRWVILKATREFFWAQGFTEVETPLMLKLPGQEPYLYPMKVVLHNEQKKEYTAYLHTSPEYTLKKMIAAGYKKVFSLGKTFRDYESFGGTHNPEFTLLEWYKPGNSVHDLMDDVEALWKSLETIVPGTNVSFARISMKELWQQTLGVVLDDYLTTESMRELCIERGYSPTDTEAYEDLFYRIFLNEIEPQLTTMGGVCVYKYPAQMAALSTLSKEDARYAERVEVYVNGIELANGFYELRDKEEQKKRLLEEQTLRKDLKKDVFDLDDEFLESVEHLPSCVGIALGIDRLVMSLTGCQNIDNVIALPMSKLFKS